MISSTPSPSISPAKSSLVITSSSSGVCGSSDGSGPAAGSVCAGCSLRSAGASAPLSACASALGLRPRRFCSALTGCSAAPASCPAGLRPLCRAGASGAVFGVSPASGAGSEAGRGAGTAFSALPRRGRRPRGALAGAAGWLASAAAPGAASAETGSCAGVLSDAGASAAAASAIFSISSRFLSMTLPMPSTFAISRNSARLFPFSAFRSCIFCEVRIVCCDFRSGRSPGSSEFACKDSALFLISK